MNIRKIREQLADFIIMEEDLPECLKEASRFYLASLRYLLGQTAVENYRKSFDKVCQTLQREDERCCRITPVLDSLLTSVFYYRLALSCNRWKRKENERFFNLSFLESYELLLKLFSEEVGETVESIVEGDDFFEEIYLSSRPSSFSKRKTGNELVWMYQQLRERKLLTTEPRFEYALMRNKTMLAMNRYPWISVGKNMGMVMAVTLGTALFISVTRIAYNMCVEFPLLRLLSIERAGKAYDNKMIEVALQCHSFLENGMHVFGSRVLFFCLAILWVVGIEYAVEKWNDRMYR